MPWLQGGSTLKKRKFLTMRRVAMMMLVIWSLVPYNECQAASLHSDQAADFPPSGSETAPSGSGQLETGDHAAELQGPSSGSSGERGTLVDESYIPRHTPRGEKADVSLTTEIFSGDLLAREDFSEKVSETVTLSEREQTGNPTNETSADDATSGIRKDPTSHPGFSTVSRGKTTSAKPPVEDYLRITEDDRNPDNDRTGHGMVKENGTTTERSTSATSAQASEDLTSSPAVDAEPKISAKDSQMFRTPKSGTTQHYQPSESSTKESVTGMNMPERKGSDSSQEGSLTTVSQSETNETSVTMQNESSNIVDAYTFSRAPPSHDFTTAGGMFTTQVETSKAAKSASTFKVTSDQLFVSVSRTRRHSQANDGAPLQLTTATVSSTVPSSATQSTSVETSTVEGRSSSSEMSTTAEELSSVSPSTTSTSTVVPELTTTPAKGLSMQCQSNQSCADKVRHSLCLGNVCVCSPGYHGHVYNDTCIREPYKLTANAANSSCVEIDWLGGDDAYNVTVMSSVPGDESKSEMGHFLGRPRYWCGFSPSSNLTVSVILSEGGEAATTWVVLKPTRPKDLEISSVNETCVTVTWQPGNGYAEYYTVTYASTISNTTSETHWRFCNLNPGKSFDISVSAFRHGQTSELSFCSGSTVPSQPEEGVGKRSGEGSTPTECVDLQWKPGPGTVGLFYITGPGYNTLGNTTKTETTVCGLQPGTRYSFDIFAYSAGKSSKPLAVEACTDPEKVQQLRVEGIDATWAKLTWNPPSNGTVDRYIIRGNHSHEPTILTGQQTSTTVDRLTSGTTYSVTIEAEFCNRMTSPPLPLTFTTNFSALTSVNVSATGTRLKVFWELDQQMNVPVVLMVRHRGLTVFNKTVQTTPQYIQTNRSGACFTVSLQVAEGNQKEQTLVLATEPAAPEEVQKLQAQRLTNDRRAITVTWSTPKVTNGVITFYNVSVRGVRGIRQTSKTRDCQVHCNQDCHDPAHKVPESGDKATPYSVEVDQLSEYENYIVNVTAFTAAGGGLSQSVQVKGQLIDLVSHLHVGEMNATCLNLTWSYPANADLDDPEKVRYLLEYQAAKEEEEEEGVNEMKEVKNVTEPGSLLCGLQYWTLYQVNITAVDKQGPGRTATRLHRTSEHEPGIVSNVTVSTEESITRPRQLKVTWSTPENPYGIIRSYGVIVRDRNTSRVIERQRTPPSRQRRAVNERKFTETFSLIGDHHYHVQVFATTGAGNGSRVDRYVIMPAGVLPPSGESVQLSSQSIEVRSLLVDIPTSLLCDFSYGYPVQAGYIVYQPGRTPLGIEDGTSLGPCPVVTSPWAQSRTPFYVHLDVQTQCSGAPRKNLSVRVGEDNGCQQRERGSGEKCDSQTSTPTISPCGGPLLPNTRYHLLVVFCTSVACRYTQPAPAFITRPQPEEPSSGVAGLAAGLTVVFLLLILGPPAFYWIYKKKQRGPDPVIPLQLIQENECREIVCRNRPVALDRFVEHVQQLHRDSNLGFSDEYKTIKDSSPYYSVRAAELPPCKPKNRYMNILPYDQSRVKLIPTDDEEGSDYINASYLPGENHQREFIAAQGPLPGTVDDFWRMVWENRVCVIVMLTQCIEKGKTKCEMYWPDEGVQTIYGDLVVQVRSQSVLPDYIIRVIDVKLGNQSRMIKHFHFMRWPDHGCPERTSMLLNFVSSVRAHMPHSGAGPTLVHCSAGVGRTGTFVALDRLLQQIRQKTHVDIFNLVLMMREHRIQMVQTENQYVYIHDCLADALTKDKESDDDQSDSEDEHVYGNC